jgi:hypothetical protein
MQTLFLRVPIFFHRIASQQHRFKNVQIAYDVCFF